MALAKRVWLGCTLAGVLVAYPVLAAKTAQKNAEGAQAFLKKVSDEQRVLLALNRLTFGPRPGDVEAVRAMGLARWTEQQLHPERIEENPVLAEKIAPLASLSMSNQEIVYQYPPPQVLLALANGRMPMPEDPARRARLEPIVARYKKFLDEKGSQKLAKKELKEMSQEERQAYFKQLAELLTVEQLQTLRRGTPEERVAMLESLSAAQRDKVVEAMPPGARRGMFTMASPRIRRQLLAMGQPQQVLAYDLMENKIDRAVYSKKQLQEQLVDFWFNHFNVYLDKGADRYLLTSYEREAIRPNVLGKFKDMVVATAESPAMLYYLDNFQSMDPDMAMRRGKFAKKGAKGLNENYGRELLELHTLGVDGGYTQQDVREVARCFTGWTIEDARRGGTFRFAPAMHDKGEKHVLGVTIPAGGGQEDGFKVIDILVHHPSTAKFVSRKLAQRFVADNPPQSLIDRMAATFQKTDGDIREVMKTMIQAPEFFSEGAYRAKVKSPLEMVVSAVRAVDADVNNGYLLAQKVGELGQPLYRKQEPTGYANTGDEWVSSASLLARMNFALALTQNKLPGIKVDATRFPEPDAMKIARTVLFTSASEQTRLAIERNLEAHKEDVAPTPAVMAGLVLGSPEFQRR